MNGEFQLILLPGIGADHRLLEPQRRVFPQLLVPPWIAPERKESLPHYAERMAESVHVSRDLPLVLGGVSFGGMLACEMARHLNPCALVLIASCRGPQGLRRAYRAGRWLLPLIPVRAWDVAKLLAGPTARVVRRLPPPRRDVSVAMFRESDSRFMHWVLHAILHWEPTPLAGIRVCQIHGRRDLVIPARRVQADEWIPDGGHLINLTHPGDVNAFVRNASVATLGI